ncbi:MAG TPA: asparagine synthase (glutamine-hydrolyzing), partial [Candidatus Krumholzibacteria bacterium]|nr:asparagine synthase (glutamine-hydrolyzing) [Candidatus Krumholzibacteria bacterium]
MCGIVGIVARTERGASMLDGLEAATQCLARRGPDHGAVFRDARVGLGHRRLAVIDTSAAANQPMSDASGRYTIVYNGEVYNFRELRSRLGPRAAGLRTQSDTEVVLNLFAQDGASMLETLNGFFAFAVYDRESGEVVIARDRFGIKPLLVYSDDDCVMFASEMSALLAFPIRRELDEVSLFEYLQLTYVPAPHSMLKHVRKLEPGCYVRIADGRVSTERFAFPAAAEPSSPVGIGYDDAQRRLVELMDASVERQLVSDVPLGAFLSGGLDSSIVVALAARHTRELQTYSIGFPDQPHFDESAAAAATARALGVPHTTFRVTRRELDACLGDVLDATDEPFADSSALAVYILSRHTRAHVTVALSGDGADEVFGGYNKHYGEHLARRGDLRTRT